jgi:predicted DNA-binding transcriptional regulator AlpA
MVRHSQVRHSQVVSNPNPEDVLPAGEDRCLSERSVAAVLGASVALLRKWRRTGGGPPYLRVGKLVRYRLSDLRRFMDSCAVDPNAGGQR